MCLAVPGKIIEIKENEDILFRQGKVLFGKVSKWISLSLVPEVEVNDYVIVHVGVAISRLNPKEAALVFKELDQLVEERLV
jgi:hydrogenase expression/formation protein HypC